MTEPPYTNREIDHYLGDMKRQLNRIEAQTTKTNGRVSRNELRIAYAIGGLAILSLIALPILGWALFTLVSIESTIAKTVQNQLDGFELQIVE